jgi:hypothetical protein
MMSERFQKAQPSLKRLPFGVLLWVIARVFTVGFTLGCCLEQWRQPEKNISRSKSKR